jgi:microcystin-dependent protein
MAAPFLAEIRTFTFGFVPKGWAMCSGQTLPINQNQALFSLLGTTYGGNGITTFQLPNLNGRTPVHAGSGQILLGEASGEESHTLTGSETPQHGVAVDAKSTSRQPAGLATARGEPYGEPVGTSGSVGGGQPHENRSPYGAVVFGIALQGIFPIRP